MRQGINTYLIPLMLCLFLAGFLLLANSALGMNAHQYGLIQGNENSTDQLIAVDTAYPNTRIVFDAGPDAAPTIYYQLLDRGDWINKGSATLNGTVNESNLVIDISSEGVSDLIFESDSPFNATILQFEKGMPAKHWQ